MYPEEGIKDKREELTNAGYLEVRTKEEAEEALNSESCLVVINSVCGCAAGAARPGAVKIAAFEKKPARMVTAFAGNDVEAISYIREKSGKRPSSPCLYLFKNGECVWYFSREEVQASNPDDVANAAKEAFSEHL